MRDADDLTTFMCRTSWKSGSLNLLEPFGPHLLYLYLYSFNEMLKEFFASDAEQMITGVSEKYNALILRVYTEANGSKTLWDIRTYLRNVAENDFSPKRQHLSTQTSHPWILRYRYFVLRQLQILLPLSLFSSFSNDIKNLNTGTGLYIKTNHKLTFYHLRLICQ